jgi:alpha-tubulin suppressor-like RCC1 family protein
MVLASRPALLFVFLIASGCDGPRPEVRALASVASDYGGPCWITDGAVSCFRTEVNRTGTESGVKALYASPCAFSTCAEKTDGSFLCWNDLAPYMMPDPGPQPLVAPSGLAIASVAQGAAFVCTLDAASTVACTGVYAKSTDMTVFGVANDGSIPALAGKKVKRIAAGTTHACAILPEGGATCWGTNDKGELGAIGSAPAMVPGIPNNLDQIGAGESFACARTTDDEVYCWGSMAPGSNPESPHLVADLPPVVDMGVAEHNVCARDYDDAVWCFGDDAGGQSGVQPAVNAVAPTKLEGITGEVTELAPGSINYFARTADGNVWAWGITGEPNELPHVIGH